MDHPTSFDALDVDAQRKLTLQRELRSRHSLALSTLMSERDDLHGVHALADQIAESLRWSA
jgi:hypothetical protein